MRTKNNEIIVLIGGIKRILYCLYGFMVSHLETLRTNKFSQKRNKNCSVKRTEITKAVKLTMVENAHQIRILNSLCNNVTII